MSLSDWFKNDDNDFCIREKVVQREFFAEATISAKLLRACLALRANTKARCI